MNTDDSNQGKLQEALATLRHRPPPPDLSARVRQRLEHPDPPPPPTFLQRFGFQVEAQPVLIGLSGAAVCLLLVAVVLASRNVQPPSAPDPVTASPVLAGPPGGPGLMPTVPAQAPQAQAGLPRSTEPILVTPVSAGRVPMRTPPASGNGITPQ